MAPFLCQEHLCQSPWAGDVPNIVAAFRLLPHMGHVFDM